MFQYAEQPGSVEVGAQHAGGFAAQGDNALGFSYLSIFTRVTVGPTAHVQTVTYAAAPHSLRTAGPIPRV